MTEAEELLAKYIKAQEEHNLDDLVSCWHPDVQVVHPMRPDRNWSGLGTYRRQWQRIWELTPDSRHEIVSTAVVGNTVYLEGLIQMVDGMMIPHMNILTVKDGKIWRARVYTDRPQRDGVDISGYTDQVNPTAELA